MRALRLITVATMAMAAGCSAASAATPEEAAVLASVNGLLDSWREADNAKGDRVLHKDFRLTTYQGEGVNRRVHVVDRAGLLNASKNLKAGDWDDRLKDVAVRIGSNGLAVVTARYLFNADGKPSHCGLVAMQLYKEQGEWKIISFSDTHNNLNGRSEGEVCPD
jgi:hypothetical protein